MCMAVQEVFVALPTRWKINDMEQLSVDEAEIIDRIRNLNINNVPGPDLIGHVMQHTDIPPPNQPH